MRTLESPGVEINEIDLSFNTQLPVGTTIFSVGYAKQGPTDELINITSTDELEQIYGLPTNSAERYFYTTCKEVLNSKGNLLTTRLPYGSGSGEGFTNKYSALVYPMLPEIIKNETLMANVCSMYTSVADTLLYDEQFDAATETRLPSADRMSSTLNIKGYISKNIQGYKTQIFDESTLAVNLSGHFHTFHDGDPSNYTQSIGPFIRTRLYGDGNGNLAQSNPGGANLIGTYTLVEEVGTALGETYTVLNVTLGSLTNNKNFVGPLSATITCDTSATQTHHQKFDTANNYFIGEPYHISLSDSQYNDIKQGAISWKTGLPESLDVTTMADLSGLGYAGMILVNKQKTAIDDLYAGYYVGIADNTQMERRSDYDSLKNMKSITTSIDSTEWLDLNKSSLAFTLTGTESSNQGSISEIVESVPDFNITKYGADGYSDSVVLSIFKARPSLYTSEDKVLDSMLYETYVGSFDYSRTIVDQSGSSSNFFLEDVVNNNSKNFEIFLNPNITGNDNGLGSPWVDIQKKERLKAVRVYRPARLVSSKPIEDDESEYFPAYNSNLLRSMGSSYKDIKSGDNLYAIGEASTCFSRSNKYIGNLPMKLERAFTLAENNELLRIDLVPEGGLGTVWTGMKLDMANWPAETTNSYDYTQTAQNFDDTKFVNGILNNHRFDKDSDGLLDQKTGSSAEAQDLYETIFNVFNQFCQYTRKDCLYIADPLRYIFVQGNGTMKVMDDKEKNYSQHILWPLKNLFGFANTNYACTYANWFKTNDKATGKFVWMPPSGWMARKMIDTDTNFFPWFAPAGLTRGLLTNVNDIGINPTLKQRDLLYKNGINPTVYWPNDGYVVWGQKTLQAKPSAFDRINVRRLFLWLEKASLQVARYFVFEQNTVFTRERLKSALEPIFEFAKNNEGIYEYLIVCDERNNTPDSIDRNELIVDIYIKPVRVAEFILLNFICTKTSQDFSELI